MNIEEEKRKVRRIVFVMIALNLALFLIKWSPTLISTSISVRADAFNSLGDFAYSALVLLGFEITLQPSDESHPHGHERFEPFISLAVAGAIGLTGVLIVRQAIENLSGSAYEFSPFFLIVLLISILAKLWLSGYLEEKGEEVGSTALIASSRDAKTDILASLTAVAGVLGGWVGVPLLDTILGMVVSVWIFKAAFEIIKKNVGFLTGSAAPEDVKEEIKSILDSNDKVLKYHDLVAHYVGPEIHVSLSVHLSKELKFSEVHRIEEELLDKIKSVQGVEDVYLHMEPCDQKSD